MKTFICSLTLGLFLSLAVACQKANPPAIIPAPQNIKMVRGSFTFPGDITISVSDQRLLNAVNYLMPQLPSCVGNISVTNGPEGDIILRLDQSADDGSYRLRVGRDAIVMSAGGYPGIVNAISTLRHLIPVGARSNDSGDYNEAGEATYAEEAGTGVEGEENNDNNITDKSSTATPVQCTIPALEIEDFPRFEWRGLHLDVSRHFFDVEEVKSLLDVMSLYKFNKFHWHLTDDEGWRIEIKKYPELTAAGAWREFNRHDRGCLNIAEREQNSDMLLPEKRLRSEGGKTFYGGYYTQEQIRDVVAYAARLGIDVIPELDMPGHSTKAIESFPHLSCFGKPEWGHTFSSPLCPGKDATLEFCKDVYREVFELFPYKYVHIGADEVEKDNWEKCPLCQKRIAEEGLADEVELQAWFVGRMEEFFNENGRTLIGWDEIADGNLSRGAAVMWWRNWAPKNARKALAQGNSVVMCPNTFFYLDYAQGKDAVSNIYNFDPYQERLEVSEEQKPLIMGLQGNLWCEWVPSWERVGYQYFPRAFAVSEAAWTMPEHKDEADFNRRVEENYARLEQLGMNYRLPAIEGYYETNAFVGSMQVSIDYPMDDVAIRYTADGSVPTGDSPLFVSPMTLWQTTDLTLRLFRHDGRPGDITRYRFVKDEYAPAVEPEAELQAGLAVKWHDYRGSNCAAILYAPLAGEYVTDGVRIPEGVGGNRGLLFDGYINIPEDGIYTFWLDSDDGSVLYIDGEMVIDNDGAHSPREIVVQKALRKGLHKLHARYWDYNGGMLRMGIISGGEKILLDDKGWFSH